MQRRTVQPMALWFVVAQAVVAVTVAAVLNLWPQWVGIYNVPGYPRVVPLLSAEWPRTLPWINLLLGAVFLLAVVKLWRRRHTRWTVWWSILVDGLAAAIAVRLLFEPSIIGLNPAYAEFHQLTTAQMVAIETSLLPVVSVIVRGSLCMATFLLLVDAYVRLVRLTHADNTTIAHVGRVG